jgi:hypothetical protein
MKASEIYPALLHGSTECGVVTGTGLFAAVCAGKDAAVIKNSPLLTPLLDRIKKEADTFTQTEISVLPFNLYKLFDTTGNRLAYEGRYFDRRRRLVVLALACWLWEQPAHIAALEDTIWAICGEYSWCLPAHMEGTSLDGGNRRRIDLFAGETGFALAETVGMLSGLLHPAVLARAKDEIMYRVIESYIRQAELQKWELMDNNWCAVCAGSVACAAMYLIDNDLTLAGILQRLLPAFERFFAGFSQDGACMEGLSYWTYGIGFYIVFADLFFRRTKGAINLLHEPGFDSIARFQQYSYFPSGATLQFSDANEEGKFRLGLSCYLAAHIPGVSIPLPRQLIHPDGKISLEGYSGFLDHCGRFALAVRDLLWTCEDLSPPEEKVCVIALPGAEWLLCSGSAQTGFAAKGGHNDEPHNHNDVGSFIFYKNGGMFLLDMGAGEYTKDYFTDKRYSVFCNCSQSHNLPIIAGQGQKPGKEFAAKNCVINSDGSMSLDLSPAYGISALQRLERFFRFDINTGILTLRDSFAFTDGGLPVIERFILPAEPQITDGNCSLAINGASCSLRCSEKIMPRIAAVSYRNHKGEDARLFTVDFLFQPEGNLSVEFVIR